MILFTKELLSGTFYEGWQAVCADPNCKGTNFFPDRKHLPHDVVFNKFRNRGWEINSTQVNSTDKDYCPNCLHKKRAPRKAKVGLAGAAEKSLLAARQIQRVDLKNFRQVLSSAGLIVREERDVVQLEDKHCRFKVTFRGVREFAIGRLTHAEGELLAAFNGTLMESRLKVDIEQRQDNHTFIFEPVIHWYFKFEVPTSKVVPFNAIAAE